MNTRKTLVGAVLVSFALSSMSPADQRDKSLERGIQHVEAGEWQLAITALSDAVRRLSGDPKRAPELADAYVYSGLAYVGLGETSPAISQFALALRTDPKARIPAARESKAALDAFDVARREAVAPPAPKVGKSKLPYVLVGVAAVGGGVAIAASAGGESAKNEPSPVPSSWTPTGTTGAPPLLLLSTQPNSGGTIHLLQTAPILNFVLRHDPTLPGHVSATVDLLGPQGTCMAGRTGEITAIDPAVAASTLIVSGWNVRCSGFFYTTSMNVTLLDADASIPVSITSFSGGFFFQP